MAEKGQIFKTWTEIKTFLIAPKELKLQYHEYQYYYHIFVLEAGEEYFTEIWIDTSQVAGIDVTQNNIDKTDFEDNYKATANQAIDLDVNIENDITVAGFGSGASLDTNAQVTGDINVEQGTFKIFSDPDQSGDLDKGPVSIIESSGDYKELAVTDADVKVKLDNILNQVIAGNNPRKGKFISLHLQTDESAPSRDMNIDGSVTPVEFSLAPPSGKKYFISRMILIIEDESINHTKFGGLPTGELDNGLLFKFTENGEERDLEENPITTNAGFFHLAHDVVIKSAVTDILSMRWSFFKSGTLLELKSSTNDNIKAVVQDNLTGLISFEILLQGYEVDE